LKKSQSIEITFASRAFEMKQQLWCRFACTLFRLHYVSRQEQDLGLGCIEWWDDFSR